MPDGTPRQAGLRHRWSTWWAGRSGLARMELVTHWCCYAYALLAVAEAASSVTGGLHAPEADAAAVALLVAYGLVAGRGVSQALHWAVGRRDRPTALMAAVAAAAAAVLALVLHEQSGAPADGDPGAFVFAVGCTVLPVAVLTVRSLPALRIAALVAGSVAVVAAASAAAGLRPVVVWVNGWTALSFACVAVFVSRVSGWSLQIMWELHDARDTRARLAVAEERLRFARDLHDVMGRNLSVLALQSELAAKLARRGAAEAAAGQMDEVQRIAREAQAEIRAVVRGYREADLAAELNGARGVLESAGIDCAIEAPGPRGAASLAPSAQAALGWVVREATTNVLRHADAASCEIRLRVAAGEAVLTVANNGVRAPAPHPGGPEAAGGTGLAGLRERLAALGGTLATRAQDGTFVLTATVPTAPDPAPAAPAALQEER